MKDTYVCYMNPSNENIRLVLLFDEQFEINPPGLVDIRPKEIVLANLQQYAVLDGRQLTARRLLQRFDDQVLTRGRYAGVEGHHPGSPQGHGQNMAR